ERFVCGFISDDLMVVRTISDRVAVTYPGRIIEEASSDEVFGRPLHPYTQALVSSVPVAGTPLSDRIILQGEPPNPAARPSGCAFHPRCRFAAPRCSSDAPELLDMPAGRKVACHFAGALQTDVIHA